MHRWRRKSKRAKTNPRPWEAFGSRRGPESLEARLVFSTGYLQLSVAADQPATALLGDPNLVGPWGLALNASGGDLFIADRGSGQASLYRGDVGRSPFEVDEPAVTVPGGSPTGIVANGSTSFVVQSGAASGPASFLLSTETGDITGYNTNVPPPAPSTVAQIAATVGGAVYKGIALADNNGQNLLYAADFHDNRIDVFDGSFHRVTLAGNFTDPNLPAGYAPFNIATIGNRLLVSYALEDANKQNDVPGVAHGIVDAFDFNGNFQNTLIAGGPQHPTGKLNSPWGMALAPSGFGDVSGELLVANSGDGRINAFDPNTGAYQGTLGNPSGSPLVINGLHGLSFGNGLTAGDGSSLFFTAIGSGGQHGLLGEIVSAQNSQFPALGGVISATADVNFSGVVAVFNDASAAAAGSFSSIINWGDGFTINGTVTALPSGGFGVIGSHTYFQAGSRNVTVQIRDSAANVATASGSATVAPPGLVFSPTTVAATEGLGFSGTVASFSDQDGNSNPFVYTATIDWGDGVTNAGTMAASGSPFSVTGSHTYATQGSETITVTVNDFDGASGTATAVATVSTSLSGSGKTISPTETVAFHGAVASFTDANSSRILSDYHASIDWGDGTMSAATITANGSGGYDVSGSHSYTDESTDGITVAITDPGSTITVLSTAQVADLDTLAAAGLPVSASEGALFSGAVATFADTLPSASPDGFSATIDWGDGETTPGNISEASGIFTVSGAHVYADEGSFTVRTTVRDIGGTASASATTTAQIADADVLTITPVSFVALAGQTFTQAVATVSDANTAATAANFTATIDWGDGLTSSGMVSGDHGNITIVGSHAYADEGTFSPVIAVADRPPGTVSASATGTVQVAPSPPIVTATPLNASERTSLTSQVASFTQPGSSANAGDYAATIDWGDGSTSAGTVAANGGVFDVSGTHVYADESNYTFTVFVSRTGGTSGSASGVATISEPPLSDGTTGTANTRWINEVYGDLLGRAADVGALTFWAGQLSTGATRTQVVAAIESSDEYRIDQVENIYQTYLHRAAEPAAQAFGDDFLSGHTIEQLAALVVGSPEYYQSRGGGTNNGFLDALFHDALGRAVDDGARTYFNQLLDSGDSRDQVATLIFGSGEYLNDFVQARYLALLDRPADAGGQAFFVDQLQHGATDEQVTAMLSASDEYFAKTKQ
jgi:uncharacterized protein (TIGR03118 family)